jgi:hypothetical protein
LGSLINTIIGNIKVSITNIHIRYEDTERYGSMLMLIVECIVYPVLSHWMPVISVFDIFHILIIDVIFTHHISDKDFLSAILDTRLQQG